MAKEKSSNNKNGFDRLTQQVDKLAVITKEGFDDVRSEMGAMEKRLERRVDEGFTIVQRQLDKIIQIQLDQHATRIKKLESAVFSR